MRKERQHGRCNLPVTPTDEIFQLSGQRLVARPFVRKDADPTRVSNTTQPPTHPPTHPDEYIIYIYIAIYQRFRGASPACPTPLNREIEVYASETREPEGCRSLENTHPQESRSNTSCVCVCACVCVCVTLVGI
jgi:hypothetical protein